MQARRLRFWSSAQLAQVESAFRPLILAWAGDWGLAPDAVRAHCMALASPAPAPRIWREYWQRNGATQGAAQQAWFDWEPGLAAALARMIFPGREAVHGTATMAERSGQVALDALLSLLRESCFDGEPERGLLRPVGRDQSLAGSGALQLTLALGSTRIEGVLSAGVVERMLLAPSAAPAPLAPLRAVSLAPLARSTCVTLTVEAGCASIGAGSLLGLAVGDVVRLDTPLDGAFRITLASGAAVCHGYIGRVGERMTVEVTRQASMGDE